ncbi:MAG TPA: hypothetical protein VKQ11_21775 [Candidatus Sulfotelmatobacter sp.]|nr:hypothetical protein [Candidatus Sulfotelmatobacter sp.]
MPSTADLIFLALLFALTVTPLSVRLLGDGGIGWHIRTGQQILQTHTIPHTDSFSSSMQGKPWFAWEWLYDVIVGQLDSIAGLNGVVWFTAVLIGAVFAWTFHLLVARGTNLLIALVLMLLAVSASMIHFLARPHVLNWLFTLAWFWILDATERRCFNRESGLRSRWLWALPVLMLVWVNVHGGFLLGFALLGIYWGGALWTWLTTNEYRIEDSLQKIVAARRARSLIWVGLASVLASMVNPYGWKLHSHVYEYLSNRFLMDHIEEFQSPNFHGVAQRCFLLLLLITMGVLAARARELRVSQILTLLLAVYTGLYSARSLPVSSILLVIMVGPLLPELSAGFFHRMSTVDSQMRGHLWPVVAAVAMFFVASNHGRVGANLWMDAHFGPGRMPVEAVSVLDQQKIEGPVLTPDYWGGYLIYRLYPRTQVVVDDRHDFYGADFFKLYLRMMHVEFGWDEFLQRYKPAYVLVPRESPLANMLMKTPGWKVIHLDELSITFQRGLARP